MCRLTVTILLYPLHITEGRATERLGNDRLTAESNGGICGGVRDILILQH